MSPARPLLLASLVLALAGCASLQRVPLRTDPPRESPLLAREEGLAIVAYTTPDGIFHGFHGKARWASSAHDSLELVGRRTSKVPGADPSGDPDDKQPTTLRLSRTQVTTLLYEGSDPGKAGILGLGFISVVLIGVTVLYIVSVAAYEE